MKNHGEVKKGKTFKKGEGTSRVAVYAGTFDPLTKGHMDIVARVAPLFDKLFLVIADNPKKAPLFTSQERLELVRESIALEFPKFSIEVAICKGLVVDFCKKNNARVLVRGLRAMSDFEVELQVSSMNRRLAPYIETFHVMTDEKYFFVSSTLIKEIAHFGATLSEWVPLPVEKKLKERFRAK
jgi:pantetheine-phosphate adenylyltransferase